MSTKSVFCKFQFWGLWGAAPWQPPLLGAPLVGPILICTSYRHEWLCVGHITVRYCRYSPTSWYKANPIDKSLHEVRSYLPCVSFYNYGYMTKED
jgi:hypothetical protein